jgi:hypothetical protein|nr:MAG TPA: hypothetical protein [Caudoviricetes sp.]
MPRSEERRSRRRGSDESRRERSTQGWGAVAKRQADIAANKEAAENAVRDFWLKSDETAIIQFLQDEPYCYDAHQVKDKKGNWTVVPCQLNTGRHCVLCSEGVKQTWKAAFKILDYRGSWDKDKKRFTNDTPIEKIWKVGSTIAQQLKQIVDKKGKDLTEMVFEVTRSGSGKDSSYNFEQAFDSSDRKMKPLDWDEQTPSAEELCQPPTEDEIDERGYTSAE